MQSENRWFVRICIDKLDWRQPVYEFGALQVHDDDQTKYVKDMFPPEDLQYVGCDMRPGQGVDSVQNLHKLDIPDNSVGTIICLDTLEHVEFPRKAVSEMHRVLKPNGIMVISSVFEFPIHGYPDDYWRFTPSAFKSLMKKFKSSRVYRFGISDDRPKVVVGVGFKGKAGHIEEFETAAQNWEKWNSALVHKSANS